MPQRDEIILLMEACHVAQVAAIEQACFSEPWSEAAFRSELTNPQALTLVALRQDRVTGFVNLAFAADTADINTVAVDGAYRRQGIGRRLLLAAEAWLEGQVSAYFLEVRQSNAPAIALYQSLGYQQVGVRPRYYHKPDEDGLLMRKDIKKDDLTCIY